MSEITTPIAQPVAFPGDIVVQMSFAQLHGLVNDIVDSAIKRHTERNIVRGIKGIMSVFRCSEATAKRIKKSGVINGAISQQGKNCTFIVDVDRAKELMAKAQEDVLK